MSRSRRAPVAAALAVGGLLAVSPAAAQLVQAEPLSPVTAPTPAGVPALEAQVALQLVIDAAGAVESAVVTSRAPPDLPSPYADAAVAAARAARFSPSTRDGKPLRSRVEYVVVFHPPVPTPTPTPTPTPSPSPSPSPSPPPDTVQIHGLTWSSPRGLGDARIDRELLTASPRQQTSEMLSAAPGFFVDHEDGEGLGNDVYLRGFDLDNGSGIEMKVGGVPVNVPLHIHGQGYADVNFVIPEIVRSVRVLEGPYDPRQGDAAIAGSALFDLGVPERGVMLKASYGSFDQARLVGVVAPRGASDETFAAFAVRETHGFGADRAAKSASVNAQLGVDLTDSDHLRLLATGYAATAALPGVVRQDDVDAGRIGYYDAYPYYTSTFPAGCSSASCAQPAQGVSSARVMFGAELDHTTSGGGHLELVPFLAWTDFLSRQNYTGNLDSSNLQPAVASLGDLWQLTNTEMAGGATARYRDEPLRLGPHVEIALEPGVFVRAGHTAQGKDLVNPANLAPWDERASAGLDTFDLAGYLDVDVRLWRRLRISGGVRADFLDVTVHDDLANVIPPVATGALPGSAVNVAGVAPGPRGTLSYDIAPELVPVVSAGEGFRSLDAGSLTLCNGAGALPSGGQSTPCSPGAPYSQVASFEAGFRSEAAHGRLVSTVSAFETHVQNELVFEVAAGGLATEGASTRRGIVTSLLARPLPWLLVSTALSVQSATFDTVVPGSSHDVPGVPGYLWRTDLHARHELASLRGAPITGSAGLGYTLLGNKHVTDTLLAPVENVLNASLSARYRIVEVGLDVYNVLGLEYPDDAQYFVSNWSLRPGQQPASGAVHLVAAPPRTSLATVTVSF